MHTNTPHADLTKTAIGYVRVSTQEQAKEGVSLDAQRDKRRSISTFQKKSVSSSSSRTAHGPDKGRQRWERAGQPFRLGPGELPTLTTFRHLLPEARGMPLASPSLVC